jgi:hypothetical protein
MRIAIKFVNFMRPRSACETLEPRWCLAHAPSDFATVETDTPQAGDVAEVAFAAGGSEAAIVFCGASPRVQGVNEDRVKLVAAGADAALEHFDFGDGLSTPPDAESPVGHFADVTPHIRTRPVSALRITFSEPVSGVTAGDFRLARDGATNLLTANQPLLKLDDRTFELNNLATLTQVPGSYAVLLPSSSSVRDLAGIALAEDVTATWVQEARPPSHNMGNPHDVNGDGFLRVRDVLLVVNRLISSGPSRVAPGTPVGAPYLDVSGDNVISTRDALLLINVLLGRGRFEAHEMLVDSDLHTNLLVDGFHFATLIERPNGTTILRPRGIGVDDWGSSVLFAPYIGGLGSDSSRGAITEVVAMPDGIFVRAIGDVSGLGGTTFGSWKWEATLGYNNDINGMTSRNGVLDIHLPASLAASGGDLNLYRVNSNYLVSVPLQEPPGATGNTGDFQYVDVSYADGGDPRDFRWIPSLETPAHFPTELRSSYLGATVKGNRNVISTLDQGYDFQIAVANKPTVRVITKSRDSAVQLAWGGTFDTQVATAFDADNVASLALILRDSTDLTDFVFDFVVSSERLAVD